MTNIIKASDIQSEISAFTAAKIAEGYAITSAYTFNDFPYFKMKNFKTGDVIKTQISFSSDNEFYISQINLYVNDERVNTYYELPGHHNVYVATLAEANELSKLSYARRSARRVSDEVVLSKNAAPIVKTLPGFRSVPMKNIRVVRSHDYRGHVVYNVYNITSRNRTQLSIAR